MLKAFLQKPTPNELLFAFKCLVAATASLYIALRVGLPRPFWAPMASCIVSQAMTGSVYVRGMSRLVGTVIGTITSVLLMIMFVNYTVLLCFLISLWVGCCMYFSMLKRTTDAYTYTVAGFTVPVIVYSVLGDINFINIQYIMDTAIARAEETGIGFVCAVLAHSLFFPRNIGPVVVNKMDDVWKDIRQWIGTVLSENAANSTSRLSATQILTDLRLLSANLPNDASIERWAISSIKLLQDRLTVLISLVSSIEDSVLALRKAKMFSRYWEYLLNNIIVWIQQNEYTPQSAQWLRERIKNGMPKISSQSSWDEIMIVHLATDLEKLITSCENCADHRRAINDNLHGNNTQKIRTPAVALNDLHKDRRLAFLISSSAVFSIMLVSLAWVVSGWNVGFVGPMMTSIFYLSFVRNENAVATMKIVFLYTVYSLLPAGIYLLVVLHGTHSFETLMLFYGPCIFIVGIFMARPSTGLAATIFMMGIWSTSTMYDLDMANASSFINGQVFAQCFGITVAFLAAKIFRSFDAQWTTRRLLNSIRNDISKLALSVKSPSIIQTTVQMLDRISIIAPRLSGFGQEKENIISHLFREMRIGVNMVRLIHMRSRLLRNGVEIDPLIQVLSSYFSKPQQKAEEKEALLIEIDHTLQTVCNMPSPIRQNAAVAALTGIRCDLFPSANPYSPQSLIPKEIS